MQRRTNASFTVGLVLAVVAGWAIPAAAQPSSATTTSTRPGEAAPNSSTASSAPTSGPEGNRTNHPSAPTLGQGQATPRATTAQASTTPPFTQCPAVGSSPSCGILIVVNPDGSTTVLGDPAVGPYDGGDDTLVGVQNNLGSPVTGLKLSSTLGIFDLDGDGICSGFSPGPAGCPFGPTGYEGPGTTFSSTSSTVGNVLFTGGLPPGATAYFGLESVVQAAQLLASVNTTHYRIDMKAWIPQKLVVDPEQPITVPWVLGAIIHSPCHTPAPFLIPFTNVSTRYKGDGHAGFDGSYRVMSSVEFDWDGKQILNPKEPPDPHYGTTHLIGTYTNFLNTTTCDLASATATTATMSSASGSSFTVNYSSANPVTRLPAPPIDGETKGTVGSDGTVTFHFRTDLFPSHGVRVTKNGAPQLTDIVNNAACLPNAAVTGLTGAVVIALGLTSETNQGDRTVAPNDVGKTGSKNTALCLGF